MAGCNKGFLLLIGLLVVGLGPWPASAVMPDLTTITGWADDFATKLNDLAVNDLGTGRLQTAYDGFSWTTHAQNGSTIFTQLHTSFQARIDERMNALRAMKAAVEAGYAASSGSTASQKCCQINSAALEFQPQFHDKVDTAENCVATPDGQTAEFADLRATASLGTTQKNNWNQERTIKWQYFGSQTGMMRMYPGGGLPCSGYDPRFRPWYVKAATPVPKDVVLIVDSSGSMASSGRMAAAKAAAQVVLDTLSPGDYINVIDFDTNGRPLTSPTCFAQALAKATAENRKHLSTFISDSVTAGGLTSYISALRLGFEMIDKTVNDESGSGGQKAILFLTDGVAKETNSEILDYITANNAHNAHILTYAFGSGLDADAQSLLQTMATNTGGQFKVIEDGGDLRGAMGSYYEFFAKAALDAQPIWTAPYWDASGLGLIVTCAMPVFEGTTLRGVVGVDLTMEDLVAEVAYFNPGEFSFGFVTDSDGNVLSHPLLPQPAFASADALQLDISRLEPEPEFRTHVRNKMLVGQTGSYHMTITRALSRGDARTEGVIAKQLPFTFHFAPVNGTSLRLAIAIADADASVRTLTGTGSLSADAAATYHRIDLNTAVQKCSQVGETATKTTSTFKLGPEAFKSPALYLEVPEIANDVTSWESWVKGVLTHPPLELNDPTGSRLSIVATSAASSHWVDTASTTNVQDFTLWRYVGAIDGVFRIFPGSPFKPVFDPIIRPWFMRALRHRGSNALSTPYEDAGGGGIIITLSKAIYKGTGTAHTPSDPAAAVAGMDFTLGLFNKLVQANSGCSDTLSDGTYKVVCFVMDESGYIVMHPNFLDHTVAESRLSDYWVGEIYPRLASKLLSLSMLSKHACNAFENVESNMFYTSETRGVDGSSGTLCSGAQYSIAAIQNTNTYLVAVSDAPCVKDASACACGSNAAANLDCKCPVPVPLTFDTCSSTFTLTTAQASNPTCPPPPATRTFVTNFQASPASLAQCWSNTCDDKSTFLDCTGTIGCNWCEFSAAGVELPPADWYCSKNTCPTAASRRPDDNAGAGLAPSVASTLLVAIAAVVAVLMG